MVATINTVKLGRAAVKTDSRTLKMARYFTAALPPPPPERDWRGGITEWGMMLNDRLGCCTCAGKWHAIQVWSLAAGNEFTPSDDQVLADYEAYCGYNPADPSTDQGGVELDVLKAWQKDAAAEHPVLAFAEAIPGSALHVMQAINLFGGVYIGFNVPQYLLPADGSPTPEVWDVNLNADNTLIGGHCIFVPGYYTRPDGKPNFYAISWGSNYEMTSEFWNAYVDEAYGIISPDFMSAAGVTPGGLNLDALEADLVQIR